MSVDTIDEVDIGDSASIIKESTDHINEQPKEELGEDLSVDEQAQQQEQVQLEKQEQEQVHVEEQKQEQEQELVQEDVQGQEMAQEAVQEQAQDTLAPEEEQALQPGEEQSNIVTHTSSPSTQPDAEETEGKKLNSVQPTLDEVDLAENNVEGRMDIPKIEINESNEPLSPQIKVASQTLTREEKVEAIKKLRKDITSLVSNIRNTKKVCDKYKNENQYLQEYVGSMMASGEMK
ncbi:hypothetical protein CLIB1423_06S05050 [[Candida] railenensis]|uniref:Uncharacterized protein n=1 Tax=[Candida] railenensis TaxID=45579 RepID=A0A9P0QPS9_9ASCO|nr:hypothetical protein CLIB1423_06S05050 [[Candida] railenensis]